jgi:non-ribosomal peptide synthetase-like protein
MGYLLLLGLVPGLALISYSFVKFGPAAAVAATFIAVPLFGAWWLAIVLFIKHFVIGQIRPGLYPVKSSTYVRMWFLRYLLDNTRHLLTPIYATMLAPKFMRLLGAKVGRGVEISTIMHAVPDLLELGEGSFLADACIVGGLRIHRGWVELLQTKIGTRAFVGNSALTPSGVEVGNNSLIGVLSTPPANEHRSPDGSRWLGSPSFELPNATAAESDVQADESRTYRPPARLILLRALMEAMRMLLPAGIIAAHIISFVFVIDISYHLLPLAWIYCVAPLLTCLMSGTTVASSALVKWALMGKFRPTIQPLWCGYVWRNEVVNSVFETVAANAISLWLGSPFASALLRLMGCKIGRWVYLQTTLFSEFDLVKIGDYAALNLGTTIQTHLFEDRVMKADALEIGDRCSIGNMSVILYGVKMHAGSSVGPLSLVMKGEALPVGTRWHGIPIEQVRPQSGSSLALQKSRVA